MRELRNFAHAPRGESAAWAKIAGEAVLAARLLQAIFAHPTASRRHSAFAPMAFSAPVAIDPPSV
jgi:hypothetical protein